MEDLNEMKKKIINFILKENNINIFLLLIASIFICLPLLNKNLDMGYDDRSTTYSKINGNISINNRRTKLSGNNVKFL